MPRRNSRDRIQLGAFHVYNRGIDGLAIFRDDFDREYFADLTVRHLSAARGRDSNGRELEGLRDHVTMQARNLMTTHFHLILWQKIPGGIARLMNQVLRVYVRYFNRRHGRRGPLFAGPYRAVHLPSTQRFKWTLAYVHDNHSSGPDYRHSTHRYYLEPDDAPGWLDLDPALKVFGGRDAYLAYLGCREQRNALDRDLRL